MEKRIVNSYNIEFGYELIAVIPYAYYLYRKGLLLETISAIDTEPFYYFSPKHTINESKRHWDNYVAAYKINDIPNIVIHKPELDTREWLPPPYKEYYKHVKKKIGDRVVVISNKHNIEWGYAPINTLGLDTLYELFSIFKNCKIVYNDTSILTNSSIYDDTVDQLGVPGIENLLNQMSHVYTIDDICKRWGVGYNLAQLYLYPNVDLFVSIQGGSSIFSSYYGTKNIIFAKAGRELECDSYNNWYNRLGGSKIIHVDTTDKLIKECKRAF